MSIDYSGGIGENRLSGGGLEAPAQIPGVALSSITAVCVRARSGRCLPGILMVLLLASCKALPPRDADMPPAVTPPKRTELKTVLNPGARRFIARPTPREFSICHGHTCANIATLSLSAGQWQTVTSLFEPPADAPARERERIRAAVGLLERIVGPMSGTAGDKGLNLPGIGEPGQMDCIDESTNTSVYLYMLQADGLLRWHRLEHPISRGPFTLLLQAPHSTAVIREIGSSRRFAVDSWFLDNGSPPFVVPIGQWKRGWRP